MLSIVSEAWHTFLFYLKRFRELKKRQVCFRTIVDLPYGSNCAIFPRKRQVWVLTSLLLLVFVSCAFSVVPDAFAIYQSWAFVDRGSYHL